MLSPGNRDSRKTWTLSRTMWTVCGLMMTMFFIYISTVRIQGVNFHYQRQAIGRRMIYKESNLVRMGSENLNKKGNVSGETTNGLWYDTELDILHMEKIPFLPNFKNPCWYEELYRPDLYEDNKYAILSRFVRLSLMKLIQIWNYKLSEGIPALRLRCLPYFLIIGQPKCGSTDLYYNIASHPDIVTPPIKELHWWTRNRQGKHFGLSEKIPLDHYVDMFDEAALKIEGYTEQSSGYHPLVTGEASVSILWENSNWWHFPENANNTLPEPVYTNPDYIHHLLPDVKLIVILRNPTERLYSDYLYFNKRLKSRERFHSIVRDAIELYSNCTELYGIRSCAYNSTVINQSKIRLHVGIYSVFIADWLKVFPRDQMLFLRLEDYSRDKITMMQHVYKYLELRTLGEDIETIVTETSNANKRKPKTQALGEMLPETRDLLNTFYSVYNEQLAVLLDDKRFLWKS